MSLRTLVPAGELGSASPDFDLAVGVPPRQVLLVASSARTGSNLLCSALRATDLVGRPIEYLNNNDCYLGWRRRVGAPTPTLRGAVGMLKRRMAGDDEWWRCYRWRAASMLAYLDHVVAHRTTANGVFGLKAHWYQFHHWSNSYGFEPARWGVPVRWVHIRRDDMVAQAVSAQIARHTQAWSSEDRPEMTKIGAPPVVMDAVPLYDADAIERSIAGFVRERAQWQSYFVAHDIEPLRLSYEELVADHEGSVRAVLELTGVEVDAVPAPQIERQSSDRNREWIERFVSERPEVARSARQRSG